MACLFQPESPSEALLGQQALFGYVNGDGRLRATNCGLAAAATLLTHQGIMQPVDDSDGNNANMQKLEAEYPPNILFGLAGTSRGRVERILDAYGLEAVEVDGEAALKEHLSEREPVAVMLQVPGQLMLGMAMPAGHWMVAYACDSEKVYLTNWYEDGMSWDVFRKGWSGVIPWCINMERKGLCARKW